MADFKKRFKDLLGFNVNESVAYDDTNDDEYDYSDYETNEEYFDEEDYDEEESSSNYTSSNYAPRASAGASSSIRSRAANSSSSNNSNTSNRVSDRSRVLSMGATSNLKVVLSKPSEYDDCQGICAHLRGHMTVVLNLENVCNSSDRRRIFDFVSGCCFALDCNLQRVSEFIYVIAPCNVDVLAEAEDEEYDDTY